MRHIELAAALSSHNVFVKLTPEHKERIVRQLREMGNVAGFIGDGINDAPALRAADIGISVDTAVDIAKEAADIILLEKSLRVLSTGVALPMGPWAAYFPFLAAVLTGYVVSAQMMKRIYVRRFGWQ